MSHLLTKQKGRQTFQRSFTQFSTLIHSQVAVIENVKTGKSPGRGTVGTGKSQTIVNLIAELLAAGKIVLCR